MFVFFLFSEKRLEKKRTVVLLRIRVAYLFQAAVSCVKETIEEDTSLTLAVEVVYHNI